MAKRPIAAGVVATALFLLSGHNAHAFVQRRPTTTTPTIRLDASTDPRSYSEQSRQFRRDYYTHDSWIRHRSKDRFLGTLVKILDSGVVRALREELSIVGGTATFTIAYNALLVVGYDDLAGVHHSALLVSDNNFPLLWLPLAGFVLSSPALSLLLVLKISTSYQRWQEARTAWADMKSQARTMARAAASGLHDADDNGLTNEAKLQWMRRVADLVWLFPRTMQTHLLNPAEDAQAYEKAIRTGLARTVPDKDTGTTTTVVPPLVEDLLQARHKPSLVLYELSCTIDALPLPRDSPHRMVLTEAVAQLTRALGVCDRLFASPIPVVYTRFTAHFVEIFMLLLPLALYKEFDGYWNHWPLVPVSVVLGFFFIGMEELAIQLEEPFSVLPLENLSAGVKLSAEEHYRWLQWTLGSDQDVGM